MNWTLTLPLFIGCFGILQGAINRLISNHIGVTQAALITNTGSIVICVAFYFFAKYYSQALPELYQIKAPLTTYKWWFIFPPLFGFLIIAGIPFAIAKLGAVKVTVGLIAAQMITSVLWDFFVEDITLNAMKMTGIIFAFLSVTFIALSKQ
ncbi:MAG: DMT family transporter [Bacteriovorax sp.]|jgi:transporter family-2 protein|nr:DMT family transporter [Bacteriovorax sp.]